jgi:hypothetical protein
VVAAAAEIGSGGVGGAEGQRRSATRLVDRHASPTRPTKRAARQ